MTNGTPLLTCVRYFVTNTATSVHNRLYNECVARRTQQRLSEQRQRIKRERYQQANKAANARKLQEFVQV